MSKMKASTGVAGFAPGVKATGWPTLQIPEPGMTRTNDAVLNGDHASAIQAWAGQLQTVVANDATAKDKAISDLQSTVDKLTSEIAAIKAATKP